MDRLVEEKVETATEVKVEQTDKPKEVPKKVILHKEELKKQTVEAPEVEEEKPKREMVTSYISEFENVTIKDVMEKAEQEKELKKIQPIENIDVDEGENTVIESENEKIESGENTIVQQPEKTVKKLVIEKPNYDFMVKGKKKEKVKKKGKLKTILMACALAISCIGCVAGTVVIDNLSGQYLELQDEYHLNLLTYLKDINNLNVTNKGLEFIETYPEDFNDASSIGKTTNWFDNLTNFITGLFGG